MKNKTEVLICALVAALAAGGFMATKAYATDRAATAPAPARLLQRIANKLNLTAEQRTPIKTVLAGERATLAPLLGALHDARKNLRTAIRAGDATEASVRAASASTAAAEADLAVERMKLYAKIAPLLTEAQRQQLADLQQRADDFVDNVIARIGSVAGD